MARYSGHTRSLSFADFCPALGTARMRGTRRLFRSSGGAETDADERVSMITSNAVPDDPESLRERAAHYRELAMKITDPRALEALQELASHYDALAAELEMHSQSAPRSGRRE
jgi:hypothetical protein